MRVSVSEILTYVFAMLIFAGIPLGVVIWFVVSLVRLIRTDSGDPRYPHRKRVLVASAVVLGVLAAAVLALVILLTLAIQKM